MKIAFAHYHLKTGGVTSVLRQQVAAVQQGCDALVLTGDRAAAEWPCAVVEIAGLGYAQSGIAPPEADAVAARVLKAIFRQWPGGCDVLHVHNPTLAKNRQFLQIIKRLQHAGVNLFLQIHDFAEDGRPEVYFEEDYPADCHYGVVNTRDARILTRAGLRPGGLHYLPNAVAGRLVRPETMAHPLILYPVRAIRRKNLGEAILLACFVGEGRRLGITLPPNSPADVASYRDWVAWVRKHRLPVDFEIGRGADFPALVDGCESIVTTSIAEGFGLAFLEPWVAGKLLWGRRLADICDDFQANGLLLDPLYERVDISLAWIDAVDFARRWHETVLAAAARYGVPISAAAAGRAFARITCSEGIDFGILSEPFQRQVLDRLMADPAAKRELIARNRWLASPGRVPDPGAVIANNRAVVVHHYGAAAYRERLLTVYDRVVGRRVRQRIDKTVLLRAFFDPERFSLLRWRAYDQR